MKRKRPSRFTTYGTVRPIVLSPQGVPIRYAPGVNVKPIERTPLGERLSPSQHSDLQPDIRIRDGKARKCRKCGVRAKYYYAGWSLCRTHARQVQRVLHRIRDYTVPTNGDLPDDD